MGRVRHYDEFCQGQRDRRPSRVHEDPSRSAQSPRGGHGETRMRGKYAVVGQSGSTYFRSGLFAIKLAIHVIGNWPEGGKFMNFCETL